MGARIGRIVVFLFMILLIHGIFVFPIVLGKRIAHRIEAQLATFPFPHTVQVSVMHYQRHWWHSSCDLQLQTADPAIRAVLAPYTGSAEAQAPLTLELQLHIDHGPWALLPDIDGALRLGQFHSTQMLLNGQPWLATFVGRYGWQAIDWDLQVPEGIMAHLHIAPWHLHGKYDPLQSQWEQAWELPDLLWQNGGQQIHLQALSGATRYSTQARGLEWLETFDLQGAQLKVRNVDKTLEVQALRWSQLHDREPHTPWIQAKAQIHADKILFSDETLGPLDTEIEVNHISLDALNGLFSMLLQPEERQQGRAETHWEYHISQMFAPQPEVHIGQFALLIPEGQMKGTCHAKIAGPLTPEGIWMWENWVARAYVQLDLGVPRLFVRHLVREMQRAQLMRETQNASPKMTSDQFEEALNTRSDMFLQQIEVGSLLLPDTEQAYSLSASLLGGTINVNGRPVVSVRSGEEMAATVEKLQQPSRPIYSQGSLQTPAIGVR